MAHQNLLEIYSYWGKEATMPTKMLCNLRDYSRVLVSRGFFFHFIYSVITPFFIIIQLSLEFLDPISDPLLQGRICKGHSAGPLLILASRLVPCKLLLLLLHLPSFLSLKLSHQCAPNNFTPFFSLNSDSRTSLICAPAEHASMQMHWLVSFLHCHAC